MLFRSVDFTHNVWSSVKNDVSAAGQGARSVVIPGIGTLSASIANQIQQNYEFVGAFAPKLGPNI